MRILWLCNITIPKIAERIQKTTSSGGGWLVGLSQDLLKIKEIELTICSPINNEESIIKGNIDNLNYYCFPQKQTDSTIYNSEIEIYLEEILKEVQPDIIHIFGTEYPHTLAMVNICEKLGLIDRIIINIQGLVSICEKHYYAGLPNKIINRYTIRDLLRHDNIRKQKEKFKKRGKFEIEALNKVKHVIGRTDWDKACAIQINPNLKYHFCNETLRTEFYNHEWDIQKCEKYSIFISQCSYPIKGFHFMLRAMHEILKKYPNAHIYTTGNNPLNKTTILDKIKITSYQKYIGDVIKELKLEDKVTFLGELNEEDMCKRFLQSHVFVSPSAIENSPNSVGEAMLLGVPIIASDVGGVKNMLTHGDEGFIYQYDAPYMIAHYVCKIFNDNEIALKFSEKSKEHARVTHNREINSNRILEIYRSI